MYLHECHDKLFITVCDVIKTWLHWKKKRSYYVKIKIDLMNQL